MTETRVIFDHRIFASQVFGGVSRYFASIVPLLGQHGFRAKIVAPVHVNAHLNDLPRQFGGGLALPHFTGAKRLARGLDEQLERSFIARARPHIVHETYYGMQSYAPRSSAIVTTVYDMIHELFAEEFPNADVRQQKAASFARADRILCISENTRRDLLHFFPELEDRTSVTLLGIDRLPQTAGAPRPHERPYLLYVGLRRGYKNFAALLAAFAASSRLQSEFDLVCIGGLPFSSEEAVEITRLGLADKVRLASADTGQLATWYRHAACFVYPSLYEGFGIPPLEAMAEDCPVVAVDAGSVPEVCGDAACYAKGGTAESLIEAIEEVAFSPGRVAELRQAGRRRLDLFSWEKTAELTAACYRSLL